MHIIQAFKMALKSLWSNKMRSFLTMLGIIIGVVTVAVLTSVASSVQTAIVSQIRSQSTLSIFMSTKSGDKAINYATYKNVLSSKQHEVADEDYYDFALMYSKSRAILVADYDDGNVSDCLDFSRVSISQQEREKLSEEERTLVDNLIAQQKKSAPTSATVYAVTSNYLDVYDQKITGEFPTSASQILVDEEFIETYLDDGTTTESAIGKTVTFGVDYYTELTFNFDVSLLGASYGEAQIKADVSEILTKLGLTEITKAQNFNSLSGVYQTRIDFVTTIDNQTLELVLKNGNPTKAVEAKYKDYLASENSISAVDKYESENLKTYTISGVLSKENSSIISTSMSSSSESGFSIMSLFTASKKGTAYVLLDDANLNSLGATGKTLNEVPISYAYLKFKTEDVMTKRVNELISAFISAGVIYLSDFMVVSMNSVASIISSVMTILTTMLTVISIISLVVGGIGIMNIMLVAVSERTREIGIRKAIGAKRRSILMQFLVEALMLSLIGGLIGLGLSFVACIVIGNAMGIAVSMPVWVILMSIGFCSFIGLAFGMFPAVKASKMQPIDALRRD